MTVAEETDLRVTAELLRAGLLPASEVPEYPDEALKRALAAVAKTLTDAAFRRNA